MLIFVRVDPYDVWFLKMIDADSVNSLFESILILVLKAGRLNGAVRKLNISDYFYRFWRGSAQGAILN